MRCWLLFWALWFAHVDVAFAQRNEVTLEASVLRGALGYARDVRPNLRAGIEVGFGFPQIDRTLVPEQDTLGGPDFEEYLHAGLFLRLAPSDRVSIDVGVRASIVDLHECGGGDCWPAGFLGVYAQPMIGWRRLKFGVRLVAGRVSETAPGEPGGSTAVVAMNPFIVRFALPW